MAKRGVEAWPTVPATIRLAATREPGDLSAGAYSASRASHVGGVYRLLQAILGHDTVFMYTYQVARKYYTGNYKPFLPTTGEPRLFGKGPGETIIVRYDPNKPQVSRLRSEDNR
jgi:hypothetical protein